MVRVIYPIETESQFYFYFFFILPENMFIDFRERETEGKREKH